MPNCRRPNRPGATIFFTVTLADRSSDLLTRRIDFLRSAVRTTRTVHPFTIKAWVVLPDHMHCIWRLPDGDADYALRWRQIKTRFSRACPMGPRRPSLIARQERGVWQRRFWEHHVRSEAEEAALTDYCWTNPVKHGLVERAQDWPYSSVHWDDRFTDP